MRKPREDNGQSTFALAGKVEGRQRLFVLEAGSNCVGRSSDNDVVLPSSGVSARHAVIEVGETALEVRDLASKNGTFLGGERVTNGHAEVGELIQFGPITLRVEKVAMEDTWLSVSVAPTSERAKGSKLQTSTFIWSGEINATTAKRWLQLVDDVSDALGDGERGALGRALAALSRGLGAAGAALISVPAEGSPIVIGSYGDLPDQLPLAEIAELKGRTTAESRHFVSGIQEGGARWVLVAGPAEPVLILEGELAREGIAKPLLRIIHRMLSQAARKPDRSVLQEPERQGDLKFPVGYLPGQSDAMQGLYRELGSVARTDLPVLFVGETGVGKECLAQTVHLSSDRSRGPFLPINCAAIPAELLEAELFGIAKGVATGVVARPGRFTLAEGGTVFLDEIGDMSPALQAKLLRALEESVVQPVGGAPEKIDVRLLAATNTDLGRKVEMGEFRQDLYYRLAGLVVTIPALRQRQEDVAALIEHFFHQSRADSGRDVSGLTYGAMRRLSEARWLGNVRELRHAVRRLVLMCPQGRAIDSGMVKGLERGPLSNGAVGELGTVDFSGWESLDLEQTTRGLVAEAMRRTGSNQTAAASLLGITRSSLRRRLVKFSAEEVDRDSE